jgi:large subunit ribosomal protein L17
MRHRLPGNQLGLPADQRKALLRTLATELLRHDEIVTTLAKAKAVRSKAERVITIAKNGRLTDPGLHKKAKDGDTEAKKLVAKYVHCRKQLTKHLYDQDVAKRVVDEIAPRYEKRNGGYTRIIRIGFRRGDASPMAIIQLV